jgi:hypothetical protein
VPRGCARECVRAISPTHAMRVLAGRPEHSRTLPATCDRCARRHRPTPRERFANTRDVRRGIRPDRVRRVRSVSGASATAVAFIPRTGVSRGAEATSRRACAQCHRCAVRRTRMRKRGSTQSPRSHPAAGNNACFTFCRRRIAADAQTYGRPYETTHGWCRQGRREARGGVSEGRGNCLFSLRNLLTRALDSNSFCAGVTN